MDRDRKLKVLMLVNEFAPLKVGGGERQAERLSIQFSKQGIQTGVLTKKEKWTPAYEERDGFWVRRIPQAGPGKIKSVTFVLATFFEIARKYLDYDILFAHLAFSSAVVTAIVGKLFNKRTLVLFGNSGEYGEVEMAKSTVRGRTKLAMFRCWVDIIIALDEIMEAEIIAAGFRPERVRLMANGIDTTEFYPSEDAEASKEALGLGGKMVVVFVGRMEPQKAIPTLIDAFRDARSDCPELHLLLVGDGPDRPDLENLVQSVSLESHVTFAGNVSDVRPYLQAGDIFVLSSLSEGMPNALLEAMAVGLACVVTEVGATDVMLDHGDCGILFPSGRPDLLTEAIVSLVEDDEKRKTLGKRARIRAQKKYSLSAVGQGYQEIFGSLLKK